MADQRDRARTYIHTCISISRIYFSPVYAHIASWSANCRCRTRLEQEERCFIRAYRMCISHPRTCRGMRTIHANALSRPISFSRGLRCRAQFTFAPTYVLLYFSSRRHEIRNRARARLAMLYAYIRRSPLTKIHRGGNGD